MPEQKNLLPSSLELFHKSKVIARHSGKGHTNSIQLACSKLFPEWLNHPSWPRYFGWTQTLDQVNAIYEATGDGQHFAWTTYDGDLYVAPVNLKPAPNATPVKASVAPAFNWSQTQIEPVK